MNSSDSRDEHIELEDDDCSKINAGTKIE